jgi:hypothetical protein
MYASSRALVTQFQCIIMEIGCVYHTFSNANNIIALCLNLLLFFGGFMIVVIAREF